MTATTATTATTVISRAFGKCRVKGCGGRQVLEAEGPSQYSAFEMLRSCISGYGRCPKCGNGNKWDVSWTNVTVSPETPCRQSCTDAMTPNCKCSCAGAHHGENVADYDRWSGH
jgi:hypothetical protein